MSGPGCLRHDAFPYSSQAELLAAAVPFVGDGVRDGDAVVAVVAERNLDPLRHALVEALGDDAAQVRTIPSEVWYERPAHTIAGYGEVLDRHAAERRKVRVIGEVEFGLLPMRQLDWIRYEAALNQVFADRDAWVVCPYDMGRLPHEVVQSAARTHPRVWHGGNIAPSPAYSPPAQVLRGLRAAPLPSSARLVLSMRLSRELAALRATVHQAVAAGGMDRELAQQFVLAVNEVVTNALVHGDGRGTIRLWRHDGGLVCEVSDHGPGLADPLAGYQPPPGDEREGGFGLWLARQLTDTLEIVPGPHGTTVRLGLLAQPVRR